MLLCAGPVFLSQRAELESVYKVYCQNHDEAIALLETYEKDEKMQKQLLDLLDSLRLEPLAVEREGQDQVLGSHGHLSLCTGAGNPVGPLKLWAGATKVQRRWHVLD